MKSPVLSALLCLAVGAAACKKAVEPPQTASTDSPSATGKAPAASADTCRLAKSLPAPCGGCLSASHCCTTADDVTTDELSTLGMLSGCRKQAAELDSPVDCKEMVGNMSEPAMLARALEIERCARTHCAAQCADTLGPGPAAP